MQSLSNNKVKIAAIWARVSTPDQAEPSLDSQITRVKNKLENVGYLVPSERILATDWASMDLFSCPLFQKLRHWIQSKEIQGLGFFDRDRLVAVGIQRLTFLSECRDSGIELVICQGPPVLDEPEGQLVELALAIGKERAVLRARQGSRDGLHDRALRRHLPTSKHKVYGYMWEGERRLVPNDDWSKLKLIFDLLLNRKSYDFIIAEFLNRSIPSPSCLREWNKSTLSAIAHNPIYAGKYYALKKQAVAPTKRKGNTYGNSSQKKLPIEESHYIPEIEIVEPAITWEQHLQILDQLEKNQKFSSRNSQHDYLLRGRIFCGTHKGKNGEPRRFHGQPKRDTFYYVCPVGGCPHPNIPGPELDDFVEDIFIDLLVTNEHQIGKMLEAGDDKALTKQKLVAELQEIQVENDRRISALADLEIRSAMLKAEDKPFRQKAFNQARASIESRCEWLQHREAILLDQLAQLQQTDHARGRLKDLGERFGERMGTESNESWRELFDILNLEIHVSPERCPSFDPLKPEFYWLEFRLGVPLLNSKYNTEPWGIEIDQETNRKIASFVLTAPERG